MGYTSSIVFFFLSIFPVLTTHAACMDIVDQHPAALLFLVQPHSAEPVATVPQAGVPLVTVGGFVTDQQHFVFIAGNLHLHFGPESGLDDFPQNLGISLGTLEKGAAAGPELAEIEFVVPAFVVKLPQQLAVERDTEHLGPAAAHLEHAVFQPLAGKIADQVIGRQPNPRGSKIPASVFVSVAVAGFRSHLICFAVERQPALKGSLHALSMPEHFEGVDRTEEF